MWIKVERYTGLVARVAAQSATIQWLTQRVNQLERENAILKNQKFQLPVDVMQIEQADSTDDPISGRVGARGAVDPPSMKDVLSGNVDMEDMGDELAKASGVGWDPVTGGVSYQ